MKIHKLLLLIAALALPATGAQAQQMPNMQEMHKRFEQMDHKTSEARKSHGAARRQHMHEHMQMMHKQMQAMGGMMGGGQMNRTGHDRGDQKGKGVDGQMQNMQKRMDMMQMMMGQMQNQHELMLKRDDGK